MAVELKVVSEGPFGYTGQLNAVSCSNGDEDGRK